MPYLRLLFRSLLPLLALAGGLLRAAEPATGTVTGRVFHPATGSYVADAEVRIVGTLLVAATESDGSFRLTAVPAGSQRLTVAYTGARRVDLAVEVRPGETVTRDVELVSATAAAAGEALRLDAFVVSSAREGNAKAIMEQRRSMNLTNSLSSDFFGDVAEGSVGEFLKNVPGVDVDYVGPDARGPRLRGLDQIGRAHV